MANIVDNAWRGAEVEMGRKRGERERESKRRERERERVRGERERERGGEALSYHLVL